MTKTVPKLISEPVPINERIRKAAAYVRVSTDSEKQLHSFGTQYEYWVKQIKKNPKLRFVGVYADEGISGKSLKNRKAFNEMVEHAKLGKIEIIFVKSVTRFGRNLLDVVKTVRELRDEHQVIVYFEEEELYSDDPMADTLLSLRAMVAEQELKDMAEQQKWAIRRKFRKGILNNNGRFYGYTLKDDGSGIKQLTPIPHEAEIVRLIYSLYLQADSTFISIAKELTERGIPTPSQKRKEWGCNAVARILTNEKYTGDALLQKVYHEDFAQVKNTGNNPDAPMIFVENNHEGIVDKEIYRRVQEKIAARRNPKLVGIKQEKNDFKGLLRCGECGTNYRHKVYQYRGKGLYGLLACGAYLSGGKKKCNSHAIKESVLQELFVKAFNEFITAEGKCDSIKELDDKRKVLKADDDKLYGLYNGGYIDRLGYAMRHNEILSEVTELDKNIATLSQDNIYKTFKRKLTKYDGLQVGRFLKEAIVHEWTVAFVFKNGVTITLPYTNGTSGNKVGWAETALARNHKQEVK